MVYPWIEVKDENVCELYKVQASYGISSFRNSKVDSEPFVNLATLHTYNRTNFKLK